VFGNNIDDYYHQYLEPNLVNTEVRDRYYADKVLHGQEIEVIQTTKNIINGKRMSDIAGYR